VLGRLDGLEATETDNAEAQQHQAQLVGQFLIDRDGFVRWANIECARNGLDGLDVMPSDEDLLAVARGLS
jgi:hypothetical protein